MMTVTRFHANLRALLLADVALKDWATTHFAKALTPIDGNVKVKEIAAKDFPALVFEMGDMDGGPGNEAEIDIGAHSQIVEQEIVFSVAWYEPDPAHAFTQRLELPDRVIQFCLNNFSLDAGDGQGEAANGVWVAQSRSSQGDRAIHPVHWYAFRLRAELIIQR